MKDIIGYEGLYKVSEDGQVYSVRQKKMMSPHQKKNGYCQIILQKDKKSKTMLVHRLVAEAYLDKPQGKDFVNHIDSNRANNDIHNLEWCTSKENTDHAKLTCSHLRKQVIQYDLTTNETIKIWNSGRDAYRAGFKGVFDCLNPNKCAKKSGGYGWRYVNDKGEYI